MDELAKVGKHWIAQQEFGYFGDPKRGLFSAQEAAARSKERLKTRDSRRIERKVSEILANADANIRIAVSNGGTRVLFGYDIWEADLYHIIQDRVKEALVELGYDVTLYGKAIEVTW